MKRVLSILVFATVILLAGNCSSTRGFSAYTSNDDAVLIFVDSHRYPIEVTVDHQHYRVDCVKKSDLKRTDKLKTSADNMIYVRPGYHDITVRDRRMIIYQEYLYFPADATKVIRL